ncbi:hypothetical protein [Lewinella sp. W8]|nr:hypothetical protein [Lewinella sp. W8]MTB50708.1 hypothetical protein [Lewinella sp. W8]
MKDAIKNKEVKVLDLDTLKTIFGGDGNPVDDIITDPANIVTEDIDI